MRQLYQSLSSGDHLVFGLAASAEPRLSQTTGILNPRTNLLILTKYLLELFGVDLKPLKMFFP